MREKKVKGRNPQIERNRKTQVDRYSELYTSMDRGLNKIYNIS